MGGGVMLHDVTVRADFKHMCMCTLLCRVGYGG